MSDDAIGEAFVSTGRLPEPDRVRSIIDAAFSRCAEERDGTVADYIPALAAASPDLFGACVVNVSGEVHAVGDADRPFSIQSVSKPFVFALVCEAIGADAARTSA